MSKRFLPSIEQIQRAGDKLPDPMGHDGDECTVTIETGRSTRDLHFKRVKFNSSSNVVYRWVYEGKVMIRPRKENSEDSRNQNDFTFRLSMS